MKNFLKFLASALPVAMATLLAAPAVADTVTYFHNDLVGSPMASTNQAGQVVWRETFRPYGDRQRMEPASSANEIWFTSRKEDPRTELIYMGARYYDPRVGRFLSPDPVPFRQSNTHSFNRYAYANNNPYKFIDPDGRIDIYIGGLADNISRNVADSTDAKGPNSQYFQHGAQTAILSFISKLPEAEPVNLFGHSFGADTAAKVVLESTRAITSLTTIDPVSGFTFTRPDFEQLAGKVPKWTNVLATPEKPDTSDWIARRASPWGESPRGFATEFATVNTNHRDFAGMLGAIQRAP